MVEEHVTIELHSPAEARMLTETVAGLYRAVFSLSPFLGNEDEFRGQRSYYGEMSQRPGFRLATARDGDKYIGFVYGFPLPPDTGWWNGVSGELSDKFMEETGARTFAIIDFGVVLDHRGAGVGKALHDAILSASGAERATLTVQEKAVDTQAIYRRWGWQKVGQKSGVLGGVPVTFAVYVVEIPRQPGGSSN
jgi:GNAT superfamily N-acetyltransferase